MQRVSGTVSGSDAGARFRARASGAGAQARSVCMDETPSPPNGATGVREQVSAFVSQFARQSRQISPNLILSSRRLVPTPALAYRHKLQDWVYWIRAGWLDTLALVAYGKDTARVQKQIEHALKQQRKGVRLIAGIGAWHISPESTANKIRRLASGGGAPGPALFSYDAITQNGAQ